VCDMCDMCDGRKKSLRELRQGPILEILKGRLGWKKQKILEDEMPERFDLPNGRSARIRYEIGRPPVIAARVQHLFGVLDTPKVARGKIACLIELLAPNQRPVQVTADLRGFWAGTYQLVRKDLRGRYPKHDWPERPPGV
jgi:ATP-dependent helicase HrpB